MSIKNLFLFTAILMASFNAIYSGAQNLNKYERKEVEISLGKFNELVDSFNTVMSRNITIQVNDYLILVRLSNTISYNHMKDEKRYEKFENLFFPKYSEQTVKALNATLSKGMSYYSKEYDIYIGGTPHQNSMYAISY